MLRKAGASRYRFVLGKQWSVAPDPHRSIIKVPDATPRLRERPRFQALVDRLARS
jgi:hypothetical protein